MFYIKKRKTLPDAQWTQAIESATWVYLIKFKLRNDENMQLMKTSGWENSKGAKESVHLMKIGNFTGPIILLR